MVFKTEKIDFKTSGLLNNLVYNYLEKNESLKPFYGHFPDKKGFSELLKQAPYSDFNRSLLSGILTGQAQLTGNTSSATLANIKKLSQPNAFTITTGHQLCLFTGPLYFIYKILSVINLTEELKKEFQDKEFVPVYWMASEDHDFEEISSFNLFGKTIKWESQQAGAVGDFNTQELVQMLPMLKEILGTNNQAEELVRLFERAYLGHKNLTDATRFLVNELFGTYGLVVVDGHDAEFKKQFREQFKQDIFQNAAHTPVMNSISKLTDLGYTAQVNPRLINCFYIEPGGRYRIERTDNQFSLVGGQKTFTDSEMLALIENTPEKISPNVVLRPLYQQAILPNLAYVGGPGELAYWLEYKTMFTDFKLLYPILVPRNFLMVIDKSTKNKIQKLNFTNADFFKTEAQLIQELQVKANAVFDLNPEKEKFSVLYNEVAEKISAVDKTLTASVAAELQKTINGLEMLSGKANKALKQRLDTEISQIKGVKQKLFPNGVPQERYDNFSSLYLKQGSPLFSEIKSAIEPLEFNLKLLEEE